MPPLSELIARTGGAPPYVRFRPREGSVSLHYLIQLPPELQSLGLDPFWTEVAQLTYAYSWLTFWSIADLHPILKADEVWAADDPEVRRLQDLGPQPDFRDMVNFPPWWGIPQSYEFPVRELLRRALENTATALRRRGSQERICRPPLLPLSHHTLVDSLRRANSGLALVPPGGRVITLQAHPANCQGVLRYPSAQMVQMTLGGLQASLRLGVLLGRLPWHPPGEPDLYHTVVVRMCLTYPTPLPEPVMADSPLQQGLIGLAGPRFTQAASPFPVLGGLPLGSAQHPLELLFPDYSSRASEQRLARRGRLGEQARTLLTVYRQDPASPLAMLGLADYLEEHGDEQDRPFCATLRGHSWADLWGGCRRLSPNGQPEPIPLTTYREVARELQDSFQREATL